MKVMRYQCDCVSRIADGIKRKTRIDVESEEILITESLAVVERPEIFLKGFSPKGKKSFLPCYPEYCPFCGKKIKEVIDG